MPEEIHYFNYRLPTIPEGEPEVFFSHPTLDIKCNQVGILYFGEEYTEQAYSTITEKWVISKQGKTEQKQLPKIRLVRECYLGREGKNLGYSMTLNGNTQDLRPENVILTSAETKLARIATDKYIRKSVEYMLKKDVILQERGLDPQDYWTRFKMPSYISKRYTQFTGRLIHTNSRGEYTTGNKKKKATPQNNYRTKAEIQEMCERASDLVNVEGKTMTETANILGIPYQMVHYYLNKMKNNI